MLRRLHAVSLKNYAIRRNIVKIWEWAVSHEPVIHYAQVRPMKSNTLPKYHLPLTMDCSEAVTTFTKWAGGPDPNGMNYNGYGYTGSQMSNLQRISKWQTRRGDLCIFGTYPGAHVVQLLQSGFTHTDPWCGSHGQEAGPLKIRLSAEINYHRDHGRGYGFYRLMPFGK